MIVFSVRVAVPVVNCPAQRRTGDRRIFSKRTVTHRIQLSTDAPVFTLCPINKHMPLGRRTLSREHFCGRNLRFKGSPKKLKQDSNSFPRRQQMSNHDLQALKRPFRNLNRLTNFDRGIDRHHFFRAHLRSQRDHNTFRQCRQAMPEVNDPSDSMRVFNAAMLFRIDKFREQITGEHRLHEPDWPPLGHLAETQSRRQTLDLKLTPEPRRSQMLSLRLRLQTEPKWLLAQRKLVG